MPYFTKYASGKISAVYTGRFAFVLPDTSAGLDFQLRGAIERSSPSLNQTTSLAPKEKTIDEEFKHSRDFSRMYFGNSLNGARWILRQIYLYLPLLALVNAYYKLRFVWFSLVYQEMEKKKAFNFWNLIVADLLPLRLMLTKFPLESTLFLLFSPLFFLVGFILSKHFTILAFATDLGKIVEQGRTDYTSSEAAHKGINRVTRFVIFLMQHEHMHRLRPWLIDDWVRAKLKTEYEMYLRFPELNLENEPFASKEKYFVNIISFALQWSNVELTYLEEYEIVEFVKSICLGDSPIASKVVCATWPNLLEFFFRHGN